MRISNNPRDGQYPFNVHAHVDKRLWESLLKLVSMQGTSKAVELRQALREYVAKRQWMLEARDMWKEVLEDDDGPTAT